MIFNQTGTPRNDRSIIIQRPTQPYKNQPQTVAPKVNLRCVKSNEKALYSSSSINNDNNNSNKEIFCFEDDVQQLNIASEENDMKFPYNHMTVDSMKNDNQENIGGSVNISPTQIKKIIIENYTTEDMNSKGGGNNNENNNKTFTIQVRHQHSLSAIEKSPNKEVIDHSNSNPNNNPNGNGNGNGDSSSNGFKSPISNQVNNSNTLFYIPSINFIYKSQDDKYRAKSLMPKQKNYFNFEKIKRNVEHHYYQNSTKKNSSNNNIKQYKNYVKKNTTTTSSHDMHHQWETLSSRIKANSLSKQKESNCTSANMKQHVHYPIVSSINKNLFQDFNTPPHNPNPLSQTYQPHKQKSMGIGVNKRKEYLDIAEQLDDQDFNKIIQIIEKVKEDPMKGYSTIKKDLSKQDDKEAEQDNQTHNHHTSNTKASLAKFSKTSNPVTAKKQYSNVYHSNRINYIKTDSANLDQIPHSSKSSFREKKQLNYSVLSMHILSNWGNKTKVGVTEIQLLDNKGKKIPVSECHVFNGNEDNIGRIVNNKTHTINDNDMWTSPLVPNIKIELYFDSTNYDVSSVIIWNYNGKDLTKGIKEIELSRKNSICWKGIIQRGCFNVKADYSCKIKLVIPNEQNSTSSNNNNNNNSKKPSDNSSKHFYLSLSKVPHDMINISNTQSIASLKDLNTGAIDNDMNINVNLSATSTSARNRFINYSSNNNNNNDNDDRKFLSNSIKMSFGEYGYQKYISFFKIKIILKESYGNKDFIGITGIKFIDKDGNYFGVETASSVGALPKDVSSVYDNDDPRIFENTFNNLNETIDETQMWLTVQIPLPYLEICYDTQQTMSELIIWNYNEPNSLDKCAKVIEIITDDNYASSTEILLMKGTGLGLGDYSQSISFPLSRQTYDDTINNDTSFSFASNDYISPMLPSGFWFKFVLLTNHGDCDWIGLNALEFYDSQGRLIIPSRIINDPETKLTKGNYRDCNNYWLINYCNLNRVDNGQCENVFTVIFDKIVSVSYIRLFNLVRNSKQGVKGMQIFCDDYLVFEGEMNETVKEKNNKFINESCVVFTNNEIIMRDMTAENIIGRNDSTSTSISGKKRNMKCYIDKEIPNGFCLTLKGYD